VPVLVMNGDLMFRFEPERLLEFHERTGAALTVATRPHQFEVPFGVVDTEWSGSAAAVTGIREKPSYSMNVNAGVYAVSPATLDLVAAGVPSTMPELIQTALDQGQRVVAWPLPSDWIDIGTPFDLARAKGQV
jgi:NDP-sugar pyrophosphorylase family protein